MLTEDSSLWVRIVRSKYRVGALDDLSWAVKNDTWSSTWKSVCTGLREVIFRGHRWVIGNGRSINFWTDRWLLAQPLSEIVTGILPQGFEIVKVLDMWVEGQGWDRARLSPFISEDHMLELAALVVDTSSGISDRLAWGGTANGRFTVSSAYDLVTYDPAPKQNMERFYSVIWKVMAPERVRSFLWLVGNQAIMSNEERHRRHLSDSAICDICKSGVESTIHILRDCPAMQGIWIWLLPTRRQQTFFSQTLLEWLYCNLSTDDELGEVPWSTTFAIAVWWSWKCRCGNVFGDTTLWRDRVRFIQDKASEVRLAKRSVTQDSQSDTRVETLVQWLPPVLDWVKLNTDGASRGNPGLATAGGVLRDSEGNWRGGFAFNIGRCSAPLAELWGVYYGLVFAWDRRIGRLEIEIDSQLVVGFLTTGICASHPLSFLVHLCYGFLSRDWRVRIKHVYREANRLADGLTNYAFSLPLGIHSFDFVPQVVESVWKDDVVGVTSSRRIPL